ncbi:hypothetical protein [Meiothermus phage MMP17]|nr:hypothetical protein [Meiothermus phage MMP7]QAY18034.1 hypothetical protein [Meiothermus phage MMP17]
MWYYRIMPALEWHDANPGAQYMVRWALLYAHRAWGWREEV